MDKTLLQLTQSIRSGTVNTQLSIKGENHYSIKQKIRLAINFTAVATTVVVSALSSLYIINSDNKSIESAQSDLSKELKETGFGCIYF